MPATILVDSTGCTHFLRDLATMAGVSMREAVMSEGGKVIERAVSLTPALNLSKARAKYESAKFTAQPETLYTPQTAAGLKARARAHVTKRGFILYSLANRYPDKLWALIAARRKASLQRKLQARGVSKSTWVQIADALGIPVSNLPGYVRSARPFGGPRVDGLGRKFQTPDRFFIELENRNPLLINKLHGASILQRAIDGRRKFFETNMAKGVFLDLRQAAKKYPGIFVQSLAAAA